MTFDSKNLNQKMEQAISVYKDNLSGIRAGRASPELLNSIKVEVYGDHMPINQLSTVSVKDSSMLSVQIWDKANVAAIEKAIRQSDLGLNPLTEGNLLKIPLPKLSEERRVELTKICGNHAEQAKIAVRNIRRSAIDEVKLQEKNNDISEDEFHGYNDDIQKITDKFISNIEDLLKSKKEEIMSV
jgi:ribosome recycling factor